MENDNTLNHEKQDGSSTTPQGKVPVSILLTDSSPIEKPLISDPVVVMPTLGDSPTNWNIDDTVSYGSPTTPTFVSPGKWLIFKYLIRSVIEVSNNHYQKVLLINVSFR